MFSKDKEINKLYAKKYYRDNPEKNLFYNAKQRAKKLNLPFNIEVKDIIIPDFCPLLEIPLKIGDGNIKDNSPSLDRIIPDKGYIKGNIIVISSKANVVKNNLTKDSLLTFFKNLNNIYE